MAVRPPNGEMYQVCESRTAASPAKPPVRAMTQNEAAHVRLCHRRSQI